MGEVEISEELKNLLNDYLSEVESNYPFEKESLKGFLEWLKKNKKK